jgi:hypothetical protein
MAFALVTFGVSKAISFAKLANANKGVNKLDVVNNYY